MAGGSALTVALSVAVVVVAMLLGLALGWREASGRRAQAAAATGNESAVAMTTQHGVVSAESGRTASSDAGSTAGGSTAVTEAPSSANSVATSGELVVTENGRVIFRLSDERGTGAVASLAADKASSAHSSVRLVHRVEPLYPEDAKSRHIEGTVRLDVQIGRDGTVHNISVLKGDPLLTEAAVEAVRQWRYRPHSVKGKLVEMQGRITIRFKLPPG